MWLEFEDFILHLEQRSLFSLGQTPSCEPGVYSVCTSLPQSFQHQMWGPFMFPPNSKVWAQVNQIKWNQIPSAHVVLCDKKQLWLVWSCINPISRDKVRKFFEGELVFRSNSGVQIWKKTEKWQEHFKLAVNMDSHQSYSHVVSLLLQMNKKWIRYHKSLWNMVQYSLVYWSPISHKIYNTMTINQTNSYHL